jgi:S-DNA-T family DNA segregation ATPase FtsK/SpoIIIE
MRASNKSSIITGVALLSLAALFTISLILLPLDYGVSGPGHNNILYLLGDMLYSVYGFCSILIPGFLLVSGLSCFASKWTARKTLRLLTALIPFFTCVLTESIIRSIVKVDHSPFAIAKILIALVTGAMLVVIEYLGTGIIADKLNHGGFKNLKRKTVNKSVLTKPEAADLEINNDDDDSSTEDALPEFRKLSKFKEPEEEKESIFDRLKKKFIKDDDEDDEDEESKGETIFDAILDDVQPYEESVPEEAVAKEEAPEKPVETVKPAETAASEPAPQSSMLTQEEFAALTTPDAPADELEWPGLPPQPKNLPPEYDADFDENDPALEFPPKDPIETAAPAKPAPKPAPAENNDPYAATRYIDSVVENPLYPHKIVIKDDTDEEEAEEKKTPAQSVTEKPKYPTRIQLKDEAVYESKKEPEVSETSDDYVEDETLPFPDFDIEEPAINTKPAIITKQENLEKQNKASNTQTREETNYRSVGEYFADDEEGPKIATKENLYNYFENVDTKKTSKKIEDPYQAEKAGEPADEEEEFEDNPQIFSQLAQQQEQEEKEESEVNISTAAASVFKDMDAEIRKNAPAKNPAAASAAASIAESHGRQTGATNLTKDELSDFFNAQQEENRPHTTEIAANPPRTNRAAKKGPYVIPSDLLTAYKDDQYWIIDDATKQASLNLKQTLSEFNIEADITGIKKGPVVTMFEILPAPGVKLSKIVALQDNIALSLAAQSVRIVAPIPGKQAVGIEVPNRNRSVVGFREIIEMDLPEWKKMAVPVVLGKDILGKAQLIDLVKTPHMLIAGATGSGKSVCVNSLILSILYKRSYDDVKMILVDPKVVELKLYNNIPHLLTPVITEPKKALQALQWCLCEMERRYALLDGMGVRDISNYNVKIKEQKICTQKLPYIVVIIDEFADLMATSGKELENIVARLTAMSRAVGIHLVLATQRPSVNVITGLIKANIPTRIAFMVASRTDSNIIIDTVGAEKLLGRGDMLYASAVDPAPIRIQGTFVSDQEVENVVTAVKDYGEPDYIDEEIFVDDDEEEGARDLFGEPMSDDDPLYDQALEIVVQSGKASASYIQRRLKIGYNRAARLVEEMEERGIVGPANGSKPREVIHVP